MSGVDRFEAAVAPPAPRLRPILMTSFAFILGVAAAGARHRPGRGDAPGPRHGGVLRDDRRDLVRPDLHPGLLRDLPLPRARGCPSEDAGTGSIRPPGGGTLTTPVPDHEGSATSEPSEVRSPLLLAATALSACAAGPNYVKPAVLAGGPGDPSSPPSAGARPSARSAPRRLVAAVPRTRPSTAWSSEALVANKDITVGRPTWPSVARPV